MHVMRKLYMHTWVCASPYMAPLTVKPGFVTTKIMPNPFRSPPIQHELMVVTKLPAVVLFCVERTQC